jgi:hypothetical protein
MAHYDDPILRKIIDVLEADGPAELKGRYNTSDPGVVNKSQLAKPMVFVTYDYQGVMDTAGGEIGTTLRVMINVVVDMTKDFYQGLNATAHMRATGLAIGRDSETFDILSNSIMGALRKNQELASNLWIDVGSITEVEPDSIPRGKGIITSEMLIRVNVRHEQLRPGL